MKNPPPEVRRREHHEDPLLNRSLVRGVEILRAFRPGADLLGNGELAERTGLSRATVSRLTQTLVDTGLLEHDRGRRAYRLAAPVLSWGHAMRSGSPVLNALAPLMRALAEKLRVNVGLAAPDRDEMVYLESVRYNRKVALRNVVAGQRVPMELTSLGRAYLAVAPLATRSSLLAHFSNNRSADWGKMRLEIAHAIQSVEQRGYCVASWQAEVVALAAPLVIPNRPVYVLNISVSTTAGLEATERELSAPLMALRDKAAATLLALEAT
ncbi:MAG: IclR family transcriptional regulator [Pseudomonadota bacterium]